MIPDYFASSLRELFGLFQVEKRECLEKKGNSERDTQSNKERGKRCQNFHACDVTTYV